MSAFANTLDILETAHWSIIEPLWNIDSQTPLAGLSETEHTRWINLLENAKRSKQQEQSASTLFGYLMGTALSASYADKHPDPSKISRFLADGASPDEPNVSDCSLLELLLNDHPAHLNCAKLLLEAGACPDGMAIKNPQKPPPIHFAAQKGLVDFCRLMASAGANLDWPGTWAPLATAAKNGRSATLLALLEEGADANAQDASGMSPIQISALWGEADCFRILAASGADMTDLAKRIDEKPSVWTDLESPKRASIRQGKKACRAILDAFGSMPRQ